MSRISLAMSKAYTLRRWGWVVLTLAVVAPVSAQDLPYVSRQNLPTVYRMARFQMQYNDILQGNRMRVTPLPPEAITSPADTVGLWIARQAYDYEPPKKEVKPPSHVSSWKVIKRIERYRHKPKFDAVKWAYLGNNYFTPLDTVHTKEIRARMQSRFGPPT